MDGDTIDPVAEQTEARGWAVFVLHMPVEGAPPELPQGWKYGMDKIIDKRQVLAAWDPKRWDHVPISQYGQAGLETIFSNATYRIKLRAK